MMPGTLKGIASFLALTLAVGISSSFAKAPSAAKAPKAHPATQPTTSEAPGSITLKVVDKENNPAPGVRVAFFPADNNTKDKTKQAGGKKEKARSQEKHALAISEGRTDGNGELTVTIPSGRYMITITEAGDNGGRAQATVEAGKSTTVTINLDPLEKHHKEKGRKDSK